MADDEDQKYTMIRIAEAIRLARELSCSQGATFAVTLKVLVSECGERTSLVSVSVGDATA